MYSVVAAGSAGVEVFDSMNRPLMDHEALTGTEGGVAASST